ncbi:MAG: ABC transporter substrate-binding protein [Oscillospiraceae bacterium]|jgi:raffinose/stachyose/melibiose transport system substrate-binding protein
MKFRKTLALTLSSLMALSVFTSCSDNGGSSSGGTSASGGDSNEPVTITWSTWATPDTSDDVMMAEVYRAAEKFTEENDKNITIEIQNYGSEYQTKINAMASANTLPDAMMQQPGQKCTTYGELGKLEELNKYLDEDEDWKNSFADGMFSQVSSGDKIYAVPISFAASCVFYNKDIFSDAGVNADSIKTWNDFLDACETLKQHGTTPLTMACEPKSAWCIALFTAYLAQRNGGLEPMEAIANRDEGYTFNQDCFIQAGEMTLDLLKKGYIQNSAIGDSADKATAYFTGGEAAMLCQGSWVVGALNAEGSQVVGKIGVFPFPGVDSGKGDPSVWMGKTDNISMSATSEHKDAVLEWMKYATGEKFQTESIAYQSGKFPTTNITVDETKVPDGYMSVSTALKSSAGTFMFFDEWFGAAVGAEWNSALNAIMSETKTPEVAFADLQEYVVNRQSEVAS